MENIQELCWRGVAIFIFCMALFLGIGQLYEAHQGMRAWKNMSQLEKDIQLDKGEEWIV